MCQNHAYAYVLLRLRVVVWDAYTRTLSPVCGGGYTHIPGMQGRIDEQLHSYTWMNECLHRIITQVQLIDVGTEFNQQFNLFIY